MSGSSIIRAEDRFRSSRFVSLAELPEILKAAEVARVLRVDRKTLYEAVQRGEVSGVIRIGRSLRFSRDVLLKSLGQDSPRSNLVKE